MAGKGRTYSKNHCPQCSVKPAHGSRTGGMAASVTGGAVRAVWGRGAQQVVGSGGHGGR